MSIDSKASSSSTELLSDEEAAAIQAKAAQMMAEREAAEQAAASQTNQPVSKRSALVPVIIGIFVVAIGVIAYTMMGK